MIGLALLAMLVLWALAALVLALGVVHLLGRFRLRWPLGLLVFAGLLVLPLADEFAGGREFAALCKANGGITVDRARAAGRTVFEAPAQFREIPGTRVPVFARQADFIDIKTGEKLLGFRELQARGGGLSEALRFSGSSTPLTFDGSCNPGAGGRLQALFKELGMRLVRHPGP